MSILQIELPDEQLQIINEQARAHGYEDSGKFLVSVVQQLAHQKEDSGEHNTSPEQLKREERLLLQVVEDDRPSIVATPEWWANFRGEMEKKLGGEAE